MAEHKVQGSNMLLFIDPLGGTDYSLVVCLTSVGKKDSVAIVDAASACGPDKSPGVLDLSYSFEGQHLQDPSGTISGTDLRILLRGETTIGWMIAPDSPVAGDEIESGTGYLSELSSNYAFNSVGTFTGTIQPYGLPSLSIYGGGGGFTIGQSYGGGYIAYIDGSGLHGLILNGPTPLGNQIWSPTAAFVGTSSAYGQGYNNTLAIMASSSAGGSAASLCSTYTAGGYTDWFLPVLNELFYCGAYLPSLINLWGSAEDTFANPVINANAYDATGFPISANKLTDSFDIYAARYF